MTSPFVRVVTDTEPVPVAPAEPALVTGYEPDRFQKFAIEAIERGENVLVTAKTGSGKTFVGEYQIAKSLARGGRVFYTTPIKSLSNQKFHDLKKLFASNTIGIMTGDIKFCPDADIIVMTTEILRNLLFKRGTVTEQVGTTSLLSLDRLDAVIFDEVHYINDPDRGHVWEETLMLLDPSVKLILLSATLSQPFGFARWLGESKQKMVWLISTLWRAVPLEHCVIGTSGKPLVIQDSKERFYADQYKAWLAERKGTLLAHDKFKDKVRDAKRAGHEGPISGKTRPKSFEHELNQTLDSLHTSNNLPAIVFVFSRAGCERLASKVQGDFLDSSDSAAVRHIWDFHLNRYKSSLEISPQAHTLRELACRGIAFHHSGLISFLKEILEILFSKGYIKVLFATETFAVGINMPTKTVVFTAVEKFAEGSIRPLRSSEYIQMAGRAGRRGKDDRGLVLLLPQREPPEVSVLQQVLTGKAATFCSKMNFHYDYVLKLLLHPSGNQTLIQKSYWWTLQKEEREQELRQLASLAAALEACGLTKEQRDVCEQKTALENKVVMLQNAKKKAAQRELDRWHDEHKPSVLQPLLERYTKTLQLEAEIRELRSVIDEPVGNSAEQAIQSRVEVLREFGCVTSAADGGLSLTAKGRMASEVNEGHPLLMVEMFERLSQRNFSLRDWLLCLALFLGEAGERQDVEGNIPIQDLDVPMSVKEELQCLGDDTQKMAAAEKRLGLPWDPQFWSLSTEWISPISAWLDGSVLPQLANDYGIFEGNIVKALLKLASLVEELQALATLQANPDLLRTLEPAREQILRDIVIAESLYLRL